MGQMAHGCKSCVVVFRCHSEHATSQSLPNRFGLANLMSTSFRQRREDGATIFVETTFCMFDTSKLFAGNRMCWHKARQALTQGLAGGGHDVAFGGAHVHQQCVGRQGGHDGF